MGFLNRLIQINVRYICMVRHNKRRICQFDFNLYLLRNPLTWPWPGINRQLGHGCFIKNLLASRK